MGRCQLCRHDDHLIAAALGVCLDCIRAQPGDAGKIAAEAHGRVRRQWQLPAGAPRSEDGIPCRLCMHRCRMGDGERGYCGLREQRHNRLAGVSASRGKMSWYPDPLPTNCVADWVCAGGTGCGFPVHAHMDGPEVGYSNLAVFAHGCNFDCLYCQNWHFRRHTLNEHYTTVDDLVDAVDATTACICYFGGDPSPQLPFLMRASRLARTRRRNQILRICWETNGAMSPGPLQAMADIALESGGCIKIDMKALDPVLHQALTGVDNRQTVANFARLAERAAARPEPPLLIASTLMVPGYVDAQEVASIAALIAALNPDIPYRLLAFHPGYRMTDLPTTSREQARASLAAARQAGLRRVQVGNRHLLH